MEDELNFLADGRRPQYFGKWKSTSKLWQLKAKWISFYIEDDLNIFSNGRQLQYFGKWKITLISFQLEDNLNFLLGKASLASPSLFWAWHSSAPACLHFKSLAPLPHCDEAWGTQEHNCQLSARVRNNPAIYYMIF